MTASWIITETATGRAVLETWQASVAAKVNRDRYTVTPANGASDAPATPSPPSLPAWPGSFWKPKHATA
jgi:hypothetical protein